jgi:hypothetical protein
LLSALAVEHADGASLCGVEHCAYELGLGPATVAHAALYCDFACEIRRAVYGQHDRTPLLIWVCDSRDSFQADFAALRKWLPRNPQAEGPSTASDWPAVRSPDSPMRWRRSDGT